MIPIFLKHVAGVSLNEDIISHQNNVSQYQLLMLSLCYFQLNMIITFSFYLHFTQHVNFCGNVYIFIDKHIFHFLYINEYIISVWIGYSFSLGNLERKKLEENIREKKKKANHYVPLLIALAVSTMVETNIF